MGKDQGSVPKADSLREWWGVLAERPHLDSWNSDEFGGAGYDLPPDLTAGSGPYCQAGWHGWTCTRRPGHALRHAAGDGDRICAVWP